MNAQLKPTDNGLDPRRVGRITGSRVGAILGLNPYSTRADVLREMVREHFGAEREFTGNAATDYGTEMEPTALALYEEQYGVMTYGGGELVIHPVHGFLAVTPDGRVAHDGMVECKAPYSGTYRHWQEKPYYEAQMRLQLECDGREWCDFVVLDRDGQIHVSRLFHDPAWLPSVLPQLEAFMADYRAALEAPDAHLADKVADMEATPGWWEAAQEYTQAKAAEDTAKARTEKARDALIELAKASGSKAAKGCGWQVIRAERAGTVAYAKAIKDLAPGADLSAYTSKPTTYYTVKESK